MRKLAGAATLVALLAPATARADETVRSRDVYARVTPDAVVLGNSVAERRWSRGPFSTIALVDKRGPDRVWSAPAPDFSLRLAGADALSASDFSVASVSVRRMSRGGLRVTLELSAPGLAATRTAEAYPGVGGFRTQTVLHPAVPLALGGAVLERVATGPAAPALTALRAGADWREPGWTGPDAQVGNPHAGTWRETRQGESGAALAGPGQWLDLRGGDGRALALVTEANDFPSVRGEYDGATARLALDFSRDVAIFGPLEENIHVENPTDLPAGRARSLPPGKPFALPPTFLGLGRDAADAAWQVHRSRPPAAANAVTFNSNGTDADRISTGAKDDMDLATVKALAPVARRLGVETFILDDGWQAVSGDWDPDCPGHPDPRGKFPVRFPDCEFSAVRKAIAPMRLGLWMSPMHFNPASATYKAHPDWACAPAGHGLAAANAAQPDDGSNEAGIGEWGPAAIPWIESRIRRAVEEWGVRYFKFDFLAWLDCAGQGDLYEMHDVFVAMLDRLRAGHPEVTFQIDETNDYRLFPFESVARGPSWFQNGSPDVRRLLHNVWNLAPYVPASSLGQHFLGGQAWQGQPVSTLMAAALPSHMTFFSDLRQVPSEVVGEAARWTAFHRAHRSSFAGMTYPLLADPLEGGWTALQVWNPDRGRGALLVFRQDDGAGSRRVALRAVPPGRRFTLREAPSGRVVDTVTSAELSRGLDISLPAHGARALLIEARR